MLKKPKRNISQLNHQSNKSNVFHCKKEVETVIKLNFSLPNESNSFSKLNSISLSQNKPISSLKNIDKSIFNKNISENFNSNNTENKIEKDINRFTNSLKQLKSHFPNNLDLIELEKYEGIKTPARIEHLKIENKLKEQILSYENEEKNFKNKKEKKEKELYDIEKTIMDQKLNLEVVTGIEKENNNKAIRDKLKLKFEKEYSEKENKNKTKKKNFSNTKEFQDELNLFLQREEYNTKIKAKELEKEIIINKNKKIEINEKLNSVLENLKNIHKNKNYVIDKLYYHYLNLLHDGKDTRNEGLCWIIREIFSLNKKVMLSYLPEFLDKIGMKYLFNMAHLNIEINDAENEIKSFKEEFKKVAIINNGNDFLVRNNIINNNNKNSTNEHLSDKNVVMSDYMEKIRKKFSKNTKPNRIFTFKNCQSYIKKNNNEKANNIKKNKNFKKQKTFFILPFINGDPNSVSKGSKEIEYTNKLLKEDLRENIPSILKVKDLEKMTKDNGYFLNGEEIKKVKNYLNLSKKLNNLRKKKENMKEIEMTRIFKEFQ